MYFGITGPFSVGKTTATDEILGWSDELDKYLVIANCDIQLEREIDDHGKECNIRVKDWKGTHREKLELIVDASIDPDYIYVCDTARTDHIRIVSEVVDGIIGMVILTCQPDVLGRFIKECCDKNGKVYRSDYWTDDKLSYESIRRYTNSVNKYLIPANIRHWIFEIDYERKNWENVLKLIKQELMSA